MFHYFTPPADFSREAPAHVAVLDKHLDGVAALLTNIGSALRFPPHFGKNFDAFWDCIRDLDIPQHRIILVHQDLPSLSPDDTATYLQLVRDAILYWRRRRDEHRLDVWFPHALAERIDAILRDAPPPEHDE